MSAAVHLVPGENGPELELGLVDRERALLSSLVSQLVELFRDEAEADEDAEDLDPAMARLFPPGYRNDEDAAAEFRKYTREGLLETKTSAALGVLRALDRAEPIRLSSAEAERWLPTLTDLRLVIAERIGIHSEDDEPDGPGADVYDWLGILQAGLIAQLDLLDHLKPHSPWEDS